jgi:hypothetical protein
MSSRREAWAVIRSELADSRGEPLPLQVGLGAAQHVELASVLVGDHLQGQAEPLCVGEMVALEGHRRSSSAVVDELVAVETSDHPPAQGVDDVVGRQGPRVAGVDETAERVQQHRRSVVGRLVGDNLVQVTGFLHRSPRICGRVSTAELKRHRSARHSCPPGVMGRGLNG